MSLFQQIEQLSDGVFAAGARLLQVHRYAKTDQAHVEWLLALADLPLGATVVDLGSGYGEVERLAALNRPDLKWLLVNKSSVQHHYATVGQKLLCDMHDLPLEDASVDGVVAFNSFANGDHVMLLAEAARVMRRGAVLLVSELCRVSGDDSLLAQLDACAIKHDLFVESALQLGLTLSLCVAPGVVDHFMERTFPGSKPMLVGTEGRVWVFCRTASPPSSLHKMFQRHSKVALSLSGGKDSLACLHLLRPFWERLNVYWLNSGDAFPETLLFMAKIRAMVPSFIEVAGRQPEIVAVDGWPSDIVPYRHTTDGNLVHGPSEFKLQGRFQCCARSIMIPLYERMRADGVTCIVRGKRHDEADRTGWLSGYVDGNGMELQFPIYEWTGAQVRTYLKDEGVELPAYYKHGGDNSVDCMHCTAYWEDGHGYYLKAEHPELYREWSRRMKLITGAVGEALTKAEI